MLQALEAESLDESFFKLVSVTLLYQEFQSYPHLNPLSPQVRGKGEEVSSRRANLVCRNFRLGLDLT